jgi:hypothetical protein
MAGLLSAAAWPLPQTNEEIGGFMKSQAARFFWVLIFVTTSVAYAYDNGSSVMEFLNIGVSARDAGTGGALAALSDGAIASYYNPAGLTEADNYQIAAMHSEWFQDMRYEYIGLAAPVGQKGNLGASFSYLSLGTIDGYSTNNAATGGISAYDWSFGLAYGRIMTPALSLGIGTKLIGEHLDDVSAFGYAADIGAQYRTEWLDAGAALTNLGPKIEYGASSSPLPSRLETGIAYRPFGDELAVLAGAGVPFRGQPSVRAGLEFTYAGTLILRGGYDSADRLNDRSGFSMGAGVKLSNHSLDYAYNLNDMLGGTHQFSFVVRLGQPRQEEYYSRSHEPQVSIRNTAAELGGDAKGRNRLMYVVCAGKYSSRADAEKHRAALELFGQSPKVEMVAEDDFRVILKKTDNRAKAEKFKKECVAKGISCFIEER